MIRLVLLLVCIALLPAAFGSPFKGVAKLADPSNFDQCGVLERQFPAFFAAADVGLQVGETKLSSRTGLIDFSVTDALLNFYDEYIMTALVAQDLRSYLIAFNFGELPDLREQTVLVYEEAAPE